MTSNRSAIATYNLPPTYYSASVIKTSSSMRLTCACVADKTVVRHPLAALIGSRVRCTRPTRDCGRTRVDGRTHARSHCGWSRFHDRARSSARARFLEYCQFVHACVFTCAHSHACIFMLHAVNIARARNTNWVTHARTHAWQSGSSVSISPRCWLASSARRTG